MVMDTTSISETLNNLASRGILRAIDKMFAEFIARQEVGDKQLAAMIAAYLSVRLGSQDTCVAVKDIEQIFLPEYRFPDTDALRLKMQNISLVSDVNTGDTCIDKPIILDRGNLYLQRYWHYELRLSTNLLARAGRSRDLNEDHAKVLLAQLFVDSSEQTDWQKVAVCVAAMNHLSIITGGPGTGKTTTVAKLLALLNGLATKEQRSLKIELVAPTGKAAARLSESMSQASDRLPTSLQGNLPAHCSTIHRLLKTIPNSQSFRFNRNNPLHLDVLIVDEASMVDLPLMCKLFEAVPAHAQVIMLGDKEQLASVEAGSVLSDICQAAMPDKIQPDYSPDMMAKLQKLGVGSLPVSSASSKRISDNLVNLQKSHRFSATSGVGQLAKAINAGQIPKTYALFSSREYDDVSWLADKDQHHLVQVLLPVFKRYIAAIGHGDLEKAFESLSLQQVLCAQKNGKWGVIELNQMIEGELAYQGMIDLGREHYLGRPVMLNENDHSLRLFNGDIGVTMPDKANGGVMKVWFPEPDGRYRGVLPSRLPSHDTVFAMTIHKSQGSEFANVYMCLPEPNPGQSTRGLSRELIYTGLTRARNTFTLYAQQQQINQCIVQRCVRSSGLTMRLADKA